MELRSSTICDDVWNRDSRRRKWPMNSELKLRLQRVQQREPRRAWSTVRPGGLRDFFEIEKICRNFFDCCCKVCNYCDLLTK
jgi:hypothetical protein